MKISKTAILPVISVICLVITSLTGHKIDSNLQGDIAEVIVIGVTAATSIYGIYKNHQKEKQNDNLEK